MLAKLPPQPSSVGHQSAARSIPGLRRRDHITDILTSFNWLRASERIKFKLVVIVYRALHSTAPRYLFEQLLRC